jgi:transposase
MNTLNESSIVVGVDVHKYSHTAVAMDSWGKEKDRLEFSNDTLALYTRWLSALGNKENMVVGLEDVNCYGVHLVEELRKEGFHIRYVPAILTERERKSSTKQSKSDYVDAKRVGKVILSKFEETLPAKESIASEDELKTAKALDLLLMERRDLVKEKTILKNQLHALLHQYHGDHYRSSFKKPFNDRAIAFYRTIVENRASNEKNILGTSIVRRLDRLVLVEEQIVNISRDVETVGKESKEVAALLASIHGCGMITASSIMAEVVTVKRFKSKDNLASYAGVSPREHSSGRKTRLHTNPFGNRRLNRALHTIALSQIACKGDPLGKEYYRKKQKEGKTKLWSLRCLKRQIAKKVFRVLMNVR